jgi:hypothetical protein
LISCGDRDCNLKRSPFFLGGQKSKIEPYKP